MSNAEKLRSTTVAMIEAFADAPDDEWAQTLVLDAIDEELRAVRREYEDVVKAAAVLLEEADEATFHAHPVS